MTENTETQPKGQADTASEKEAEMRREWHADFEAASRRTLELRLKYAFFGTYKPVLDDAPFRSFESMEEYREWCNANVPGWLGYGSTND